jgi:hypothetical protein
MSQFSTAFLFTELNSGTELDTIHVPAKVRFSFHVILDAICSWTLVTEPGNGRPREIWAASLDKPQVLSKSSDFR